LRLILFDKRGMRLSDRVAELRSLEFGRTPQQVDALVPDRALKLDLP